ncbi:hypothetical protein CHS0354_000782 [Potamilus streckersoni]|uniref:3-dehydroquinate synthase n=1 Tax=Potamilus streckersoni TaxID=2493646 RepID=A0AAE0W8L1_9BIVA|nr:hypothetical protein CHS0354_000782 [Potamilus streckersoni]
MSNPNVSIITTDVDFPMQKKVDLMIGSDSLSLLNEWLLKQPCDAVFVLVDSNTKEHCLPLLLRMIPSFSESVTVIEIPNGEQSKSFETVMIVSRKLLEKCASRHALLLNLGGGVLTDLGGFVASIYKRGIGFVQIPTTLLAQVDASVGGKTGIDFEHVKNTIGTFAVPNAVFIDTRFLETLSDRELKSGFAEMVKHGLILDDAFYNELKMITPSQVTPKVIEHSVKLKNLIVSQDPRETGKERKALNFGHTIGHAIESMFMETWCPLLHGEAVVAGMICESYLSHRHSGLSKNELDDIRTFLTSRYDMALYDLSVLNEENDNYVLHFIRNDKKSKGGSISFSLINRIGKFVTDCVCSDVSVKESLDFLRKKVIKRW